MSTPIPSDGYQIPPNNPTGKLFWQQTLDNLHGRLVDLKAEVAVTIESLGDDATALALDLVANSVAAQIEDLETRIAGMVTEINEAEDVLHALQNASFIAGQVAVTEIAGLEAENVQAALAELVAVLSALDTVAARKADTYTKTEVDDAIAATSRRAAAYALAFGGR